MGTKDFRADRLRGFRIIGSGSKGSPGLIIHSSSWATKGGTTGESSYAGPTTNPLIGRGKYDGGGPLSMLYRVGRDVELFVSGAVGQKGRWVAGAAGTPDGGVTLVGGDLVVSGTIYYGGSTEVLVPDADWTDGGGKLVTTSSIAVDSDGKYVDSPTLGMKTDGTTYNMEDVYFYVSGAMGAHSRHLTAAPAGWPSARTVSVFGGDLVVSGTLYAERQVIEVDELVDGTLIVSGGAEISGSAIMWGSVQVNKGDPLGAGNAFVSFGPTLGSTGYGFRSSAGIMQFKNDGGAWTAFGGGGSMSSFIISDDNANTQTITDGETITVSDGTGISVEVGATDEITISVDYLGANNFIDQASDLEGTPIAAADTIVYHDNDDNNVKKGLVSDLPFAMADVDWTDGGHKLVTTSSVSIDSNGKYVDNLGVITVPTRPDMDDAFFFVSGAKDSRGTSIRGTSVFGGDVVVSGTLYAEKQVIEVDGSVTGALYVSGGLYVSQSALIEQGLTVNLENTVEPGRNFRVLGGNPYGTLLEADPEDSSVVINGGFADDTDVFTVWTRDVGGTDVDRAFVISPVDVLVNHDGTNKVDFRVRTDVKRGAIITDAATNQVIFGANAGSAADAYGNSLPLPDDISVYLSGVAEGRGGGSPRTIVAAGDTVISGSLLVSGALRDGGAHIGGTISGSIHYTHLGMPYLKQGSNVTIVSESNGQITISSTAGGSMTSFNLAGDSGATPAITDGDTVTITGGTGITTLGVASDRVDISLDMTALPWTAVGGTNGTVYPTDTTHSAILGSNNPGIANMILNMKGGAVFNNMGLSTADSDVRIATDTKPSAFETKASTDQILILSGGASLSPNEASAGDVAFYVSGSVGRKGDSSHRGTALFGGDLQISGALHIAGTTTAYESGESVSIILNSRPSISNTSKIVWDTNMDGAYAPDAQIYETGGDLYLSASDDVRIRGEFGDIIAECADDMLFRPGNKLTITEKAANVGNFFETWAQPLVGNFHSILDLSAERVLINDGMKNVDFRVESMNLSGAIVVDAARDAVILGSNQDDFASVFALGLDVTNYLSGTVESRNTIDGGTTLVAGDLYVSGAIYEQNYVSFSAYVNTDSNASSAQYAVFDQANYTSFTPQMVSPAKGATMNTSGRLMVDSPIQAQRQMSLSFTLILLADAAGHITVEVRDGSLGGSMLYVTPNVFVTSNNKTSFSCQLSLPSQARPIIAVNGGGVTQVSVRDGSVVTYRSIT